MRVFKQAIFAKWARKHHISDAEILNAVEEIRKGLIDANLGAFLIKKRIGSNAKGKSGGVRTIVIHVEGEKAFFVYGFPKNAQENITPSELAALKLQARFMVKLTDAEIQDLLDDTELIEIV